MKKEKIEEEISEFMQDFFVTYEPQKYQAYPCHITEFQEECITEKLKELLSSRDTYWKERVRKEVEGLISEGISLEDDRECSRIITESDGSERTNMHYILDYKIKKYNQALDTLLDNLK